LESEHAEAKVRVAALRTQLAELNEGSVVLSRIQSDGLAPTPPRSSAEKVRLFRQLFRGREDLYPTRFVGKKTGKPGYAPACSNKLVAGLCQLPKVKCGDCSNQAFRPVDDGAVLRHLRGEQVMGVYPTLPDETCWFLAADFDKSTWQEDVRSFAETARNLAIGYARREAPLGYGEPNEACDDDVLRNLDHESATYREEDFGDWVL